MVNSHLLYHVVQQAIDDTYHQILHNADVLRAWHVAVHASSSLVTHQSSMVGHACASEEINGFDACCSHIGCCIQSFLYIRPLLSHPAWLSLKIVDPTLY